MVHLVCTWLNFPCPLWHSPTRSSHILSSSLNFQHHTMLDPVFTVNMSKLSRPTFLDWLVPILTVLRVLHFSFIQFTPTQRSNHAHFGWLFTVFCFHRPGLSTMYQTIPLTSGILCLFLSLISNLKTWNSIALQVVIHSAKMTQVCSQCLLILVWSQILFLKCCLFTCYSRCVFCCCGCSCNVYVWLGWYSSAVCNIDNCHVGSWWRY